MIQLTCFALMAIFAVGQLLLAIDRSPSSDDALFLSVPKNWLNGYGWATSYSEKIPFNPDFTGPAALLLPAALLMKLFGFQWWIAGVTGAVCNLLLAGLCLWQVRHYGKSPALAMLCLGCGIVAGFTQDFASLIGYYSGSLLFLLATLFAFNPQYSLKKRGWLIGTMTAISLLIKPLLLPAFILLTAFFIAGILARRIPSSHENDSKNKKSDIWLLLGTLAIPVIIVAGCRNLLQQQALADYSPAYHNAYAEYKKEFVHQHGSGIGQWLQAGEKLPHVLRNADKNLYFVDEGLSVLGIKNPFIGKEPADIHHVAAILYITALMALVFFSLRRLLSHREQESFTWLILVNASCILVYVLWFVFFAMAMSPGHLYFPMQWSLLLFLLLVSRCWQPEANSRNLSLALLVIVLSLGFVMQPANRSIIFLLDRKNIMQTAGLDEASRYIHETTFPAPLAGCGYSNYPRHIEYRLPTSQNFSDCLDLVEDHVTLENGHYRWQSPLAFALAMSQQSFGFEPANASIINACKNNVLYRNSDTYIMLCRFEDLQTIDLDTLMRDINSTHRWYRTRLSVK